MNYYTCLSRSLPSSWFNTVDYTLFVQKSTFFILSSISVSGKRRPRTTQSMASFRTTRRQDIKRVASAPAVANSYRNQVKAGIIRAMLPRSDSTQIRSAFGAAEVWKSKLLTARPTLEQRLYSKNSWQNVANMTWNLLWILGSPGLEPKTEAWNCYSAASSLSEGLD